MLTKLKPKSEFSRNVLTLMTGTTIAQAIPIAISPVLTRIYTPEDFGVLALFTAITSIFGTIANGRYELAIMLPKKDEDAINIFALGFIITSLLSLLLLVLVVVFNGYFTKLLNNDEISVWLYFVPISVFFTGMWNILNYFNIRKKQYKDLAKATIIKSIVTAIIQLSIGLLKNGVTGLISGQLLSQLFSNTKLLSNIIKDKILLSKMSKLKIIALAKRYKDFLKFSMWGGLLNHASFQIPALLLSSFFSMSIVGFYSLAYKMSAIPSSFIGSSIGQVFYQKSSEVKKIDYRLKEIFLKTYKKLIMIAIMPYSILHVFGDKIFTFIFGSEWLIAGEYVQLLSIWLMLTFITSPLSNIMSTLEKQQVALKINIFIFFSRLFVFVVGSLIIQDAYFTIFLYSLLGTIINIFMLWYFFTLTKVHKISNFMYLFYKIIIVIFLLEVLRFYIFRNLGVYS